MDFATIYKTIKNATNFNKFTDKEVKIKKELDLMHYEQSVESENFLIHSADVSDILQFIPIKKDAKMIHSYIMGYYDISDVNKILDLLPFEDDKDKIINERARRDLAKKLETNSTPRIKEKPYILYRVLLSIMIISGVSITILKIDSAENPSGIFDTKDSLGLVDTDKVLCGKEIRKNLSESFEKYNEEIKACNVWQEKPIVRISARLYPKGYLEEIIVDSDIGMPEEFTKCIYDKLSLMKFSAVCESVIINKTFYM